MCGQKRDDPAGKQYGYWHVTDEYILKNGYKKWKCICKCGSVRMVNENNLYTGKSKSCGCYAKEAAKGRIKDLTGQTYGRLIVLKRADRKRENRVCWECVCECGNHCVVTGHELAMKKTKSCGCLQREPKQLLDLKGQRFGMLTAVHATDKRSYKGSVIWHCCCECGNEIDVAADGLVNRHYVSCGCAREDRQKQIYKTLHLVDNTCIEFLEKRKGRSDNTSGYQGVYCVRGGKYRAMIGFNGKRYHLGYFSSYEEARDARQRAEENLHQAFVEQYYRWRERADLNQRWAKENPIRFEVYQDNGTRELVVISGEAT